MPNIEVSVVIPAQDEQENISKLICEIHQALHGLCEFEIVLVDDGSRDDTLGAAVAAARSRGVKLHTLRHQHNSGQSAALQTGIRNARGRLIVTMDGDGQNDPADIPVLLDLVPTISAVDFCIAGYRKARRDTAWKRLQSRWANRIRNAFLHDGVPDSGCGLKLFPRSTFLKLPWFDHGHRFIPALVKGIDGRILVVETRHRERTRGVSKYTAWNRAGAGLLDLFGVMWLLHRCRTAETTEHHDYKAPLQ
tara:strand:+ start:127271 stop:128020 length:750 start_codon:yes stop_codon:yes gene_type:complete